MEDDAFKKRRLLFNMATGSGKTLMMASLILYAYTKGYRNFLFFVNSSNILVKTRSNFLDSRSSKYLFNKSIFIDGHFIPVREVSHFNESQDNAINICMTTIQGLHSSLIEERENSFALEDFKKNKIVMLGDEAHHFNKTTKEKEKKDNSELFDIENSDKNWENSIDAIFASHPQNLYLEFTATIDWDSTSIVEKYIDKLIFQYDLREFRKEKYSKEIDVLQSNLDTKNLMLQSVILSEYRRCLSMDYNIPHYKPVILFKSKYVDKAKKEPHILTSLENQSLFSQMIDNLSINDITNLMPTIESFLGFSDDIVKRAQEYFQFNYEGGLERLVIQIKDQFQPKYLLNVNDIKVTDNTNKKIKQEQEKKGHYLNTLEDPSNPFRAIFAVDKLNEGWDVLNLFDIVRLYNTRDANTKTKKAGKTTISEAQLIGRGARYYPFITQDGENPDIRKYDEFADDPRKILETMYYHSEHNPQYISELKEELIKQKLMEAKEDIRIFQIKEDLLPKLSKKVVYSNEKRKKDKTKDIEKYQSAMDILNEKLKTQNFIYRIKTGERQETRILEDKDISHKKIPYNSLKVANQTQFNKISWEERENIHLCAWLYQNINFEKYKDVIINTKIFLQDLNFQLTLEYVENQYNNIHWHEEYFNALVQKVYPKIVQILAKGYSEYYGEEVFTAKPLGEVFKPRMKKIQPILDKTTVIGQKIEENTPYFYAQNFLAWDSKLEEEFLNDIKPLYQELNSKGYYDIFLLRNDQQLPIHHFETGKAFYPDFLLFCSHKKEKETILQLFLEVKGDHLKPQDKWKEEFLLSLEKKSKMKFKHESDKYKVLGLEFYTKYNEADFIHQLKEKIQEQTRGR